MTRFEDTRGAALLVCAVVLATFLAVVGLPIVLGALAWNSIPDRYRELVEHPDQDFARITGLAWPAGAKVLSVDDDHGGFHGDGTFYLVAEVDRAVLDRWLRMPPPFGVEKWGNEEFVGSWCAFGTDTRSTPPQYKPSGKLLAPRKWSGDPDVIRVLSSPEVWRASKDAGPRAGDWANGAFFALDFEANRFWLCVWDT